MAKTTRKATEEISFSFNEQEITDEILMLYGKDDDCSVEVTDDGFMRTLTATCTRDELIKILEDLILDSEGGRVTKVEILADSIAVKAHPHDDYIEGQAVVHRKYDESEMCSECGHEL